MTLRPDQALSLIGRNPNIGLLLHGLAELGLKDCHLTAGCLFQTLWNIKSGQPPASNIKDYDVFYFDDSDLSWEAEDATIARVKAALAGLGLSLDIKNQARVHLWYRDKFGGAYPRLRRTTDGIDRFLIPATALGIACSSRALYAPYGLEETWGGMLRINPVNPHPDAFRMKAEAYKSVWPWLHIAG